MRAIAHELAQDVVTDLRQLVPMRYLAISVQHALLDEISPDLRHHGEQGKPADVPAGEFTGLRSEIARALDWILQHDPALARGLITETALYLRDRHPGVPNTYLHETLMTALTLDGNVDRDDLQQFLDLILLVDHDQPAPDGEDEAPAPIEGPPGPLHLRSLT